MPKFTYRGGARALVIAGRTLFSGVSTELTGRAAEAAAAHPDIHEGEEQPAAAAPDDARAALEAMGREELRELARDSGLPSSGLKDELVDRLAEVAEAADEEEDR